MTRTPTIMTSVPTLVFAALLVSMSPSSHEVREGNVPELFLLSAGSLIELDDELQTQITAALMSYFESCLTYGAVVGGNQPPQEDLERLWSEQSPRTHALLEMTGALDSHHAQLRGKRFTLLVGLESRSGPSPVLTRDDHHQLTRYIKCPGLDGLLLSCQVHGVVPGMSPSPDCDRFKAIDRQRRETGPAEGASANQ